MASTGATAYQSIEELCRHNTWVLSCVSDDGAMLQINRAIANCQNKPAIHISFSSCSPAAVREAAKLAGEQGVRFLNCPILGRPDVVLAGKAGYLVAGEASAATSVQPMLAILSGSFSNLGPVPEQSAIIKLAINYFIALTIGGLTEIISALEHNHSSTGDFLDVINKSPAGSPLISLFGGLITSRAFSPPLFDLQLAQKDIGYFGDLTGDKPDYFLSSAIADHMAATIKSHDQPIDWSGLASHLFN